ncbi:MAG: glycosyltransferase family 9 protein [Deltaproteobacteria bacterium]|nr:glycosyltransferase family 9 protein [Deltaproteobacteria bacterium]
MDVIIINLTRMGDILQSTPLMEGIKNRYPRCRITCLINSCFAEICNAIPLIDNLVTFDLGKYHRELKNHTISLVEGHRILEKLITGINEIEYDLLINLTPSREGAIISSLIGAREVRGLTIDGEGHRLIKDRWMRYFMSSVFNRHTNPFNLVDMYSKVVRGVGRERRLHLEVPTDAVTGGDELLRESGVNLGKETLIGFQPGASREHKRWSVAGFSELGRRLYSERGAKVVLIGSKGECEIGAEISGHVGEGCIDMTGKTTPLEAAAIVKRCALMVTNDSGVMHIATAVGTPVIELSLGAAYFRETGPYGVGNFVLEAQISCHPCDFSVTCSDMPCREYIRAEQVMEVIAFILDGVEATSLEDSPLWQGVQLYRATFDEEDLIHYIPVISRSMSKDDLFSSLYRVMWKYALDPAGISGRGESGAALQVILDATPLIWGEDLTGGQCLAEKIALKRISELSEKGSDLSERLIGMASKVTPEGVERKVNRKDISIMERLGSDLAAIDDEIDEIGALNTYLHPLTDIFRFGKESLDESAILPLAQGTQKLYSDLAVQSATLFILLEKGVIKELDGQGEKRVIKQEISTIMPEARAE